MQGVLNEQKQRNNFELFGSHSVSNLFASANAIPVMESNNTRNNNSNRLSPQNFDINIELRKLLIVCFLIIKKKFLKDKIFFF